LYKQDGYFFYFCGMKKWILLCLLMLPILASNAKNAKQKILQAETDRYNAMIAQDTFALAGMIANSVVYYHSNGILDTKQSLLQSIATKELVHKNITIEDAMVRVYQRKTAIVSGKCMYDIIYKNTPMQLHFVYVNVYTKLKGKWILVNRQTTKIS
jgi:carbonic anhydrase